MAHLAIFWPELNDHVDTDDIQAILPYCAHKNAPSWTKYLARDQCLTILRLRRAFNRNFFPEQKAQHILRQIQGWSRLRLAVSERRCPTK